MPLFDIIAAIILAISLIYSLVRGMVREIFSLLAYIGGYFLAITFRQKFSATLSQYISNTTASEIISFALIFIASVFVISLLGKGIQKLVHSAPGLSGLDRLFGGVIGLGKGIIVLIILMFFFKFFPDINREINKDSFFAPKLAKLSKALEREVDTNKIVEKLPKFDLNGVKKQLKNLKDINITDSFKSEDIESETIKGTPQDDYTNEDKNKLNEILLSLEKK
jgi:membrane protein required for colicin V production